MRFLLDTNFCIACLRRKPRALAALAAAGLEDVAVSAITVGELHAGAFQASVGMQELKKVQAFLKPLPVLAFDQPEAIQWARLEAVLRQAGNAIEAEDGMIAATALEHGLTVITGNTKHFTRVPGLKVEDWLKGRAD